MELQHFNPSHVYKIPMQSLIVATIPKQNRVPQG